jgi:hypothetical protein
MEEVRQVLGSVRQRRYRPCEHHEGVHPQAGDVDRSRCMLHVRKGKRGHDRYVPVPGLDCPQSPDFGKGATVSVPNRCQGQHLVIGVVAKVPGTDILDSPTGGANRVCLASVCSIKRPRCSKTQTGIFVLTSKGQERIKRKREAGAMPVVLERLAYVHSD